MTKWAKNHISKKHRDPAVSEREREKRERRERKKRGRVTAGLRERDCRTEGDR